MQHSKTAHEDEKSEAKAKEAKVEKPPTREERLHALRMRIGEHHLGGHVGLLAEVVGELLDLMLEK